MQGPVASIIVTNTDLQHNSCSRKKIKTMGGSGGASKAALVINDRTENLRSYLRPKDSKFGKTLFVYIILSLGFLIAERR